MMIKNSYGFQERRIVIQHPLGYVLLIPFFTACGVSETGESSPAALIFSIVLFWIFVAFCLWFFLKKKRKRKGIIPHRASSTQSENRNPPELPIQMDAAGKIFISYRRRDSADVTGRLFDRLKDKFGKDRIYKDVDSIPLGQDFREHIRQAINNTDVFLSVIGPDWSKLKDEGDRTIEDPNDFVRIENEIAIERGIPVIPVLVRYAEMPSEAELPKSVQTLAFRNATKLRPDPDFEKDVARLIHAIEQLMSENQD